MPHRALPAPQPPTEGPYPPQCPMEPPISHSQQQFQLCAQQQQLCGHGSHALWVRLCPGGETAALGTPLRVTQLGQHLRGTTGLYGALWGAPLGQMRLRSAPSPGAVPAAPGRAEPNRAGLSRAAAMRAAAPPAPAARGGG